MWCIRGHGTQRLWPLCSKLMFVTLGYMWSIESRRKRGNQHASILIYRFLKCCYCVMESCWRHCTYFVGRQNEINVPDPVGLLMAISFLALILKTVLLLYQFLNQHQRCLPWWSWRNYFSMEDQYLGTGQWTLEHVVQGNMFLLWRDTYLIMDLLYLFILLLVHS